MFVPPVPAGPLNKALQLKSFLRFLWTESQRLRRAAGAAGTPKINDFRQAPKPCITNVSVKYETTAPTQILAVLKAKIKCVMRLHVGVALLGTALGARSFLKRFMMFQTL